MLYQGFVNAHKQDLKPNQRLNELEIGQGYIHMGHSGTLFAGLGEQIYFTS